MYLKSILLVVGILFLSVFINASVDFDTNIYVNPFFFGQIKTPEGELISPGNSTINNQFFQVFNNNSNVFENITSFTSNSFNNIFILHLNNNYQKISNINLYRFYFKVTSNTYEITDENLSVLFKIE